MSESNAGHFCCFVDPPGDKVVMHVLVHEEHDGSPWPQSHDLWHYALVQRQEPATVNHPPLLPSHGYWTVNTYPSSLYTLAITLAVPL